MVAVRARPKTVYSIWISDTEVRTPPTDVFSPSKAEALGPRVGVGGMLEHSPIVTTSASVASPCAGIWNERNGPFTPESRVVSTATGSAGSRSATELTYGIEEFTRPVTQRGKPPEFCSVIALLICVPGAYA